LKGKDFGVRLAGAMRAALEKEEKKVVKGCYGAEAKK
jgi:hypothetical protein